MGAWEISTCCGEEVKAEWRMLQQENYYNLERRSALGRVCVSNIARVKAFRKI